MFAYLSPPDFIPALASSHSSFPPASQARFRQLRPLSARFALGSLARLIRDPATTLAKCLDGTPLLNSFDHDSGLDDQESAEFILRLRLHSVRLVTVQAWKFTDRDEI